MTTRLHLDYETASKVDLRKSGAYLYARHPSTKILMLGWAFDDDTPQVWEPHKGPLEPEVIKVMQASGVNKHAFNAQFERLITQYVLGIHVPYSQWRCTMVEAYYLGFAGGLDNILEAVGLEKKDKRGSQLINMFCSPTPKNHKAEWYDYTNRPIEWEEFKGYCLQDVKVERNLYHFIKKFPAMPEWDLKQWFLDQRINDRGVPMDVEMAKSAIFLWEDEKLNLTETLTEITGLTKVTREPFLSYLSTTFDVKLDNLRKDYLATLLSKNELPKEAQEVIDIWAQKEAKATSKYMAVVNATDTDGRARGMFQYKGAQRTDRVGGRVIQLQNLKRPFVPQEGIDTLVKAIKLKEPRLIKMLYGKNVSDVLGGSVRHVVSAPVGKTFTIADLTSIESVILGWVSMCTKIDTTFRQGKDSYKVFAEAYFGVSYEQVTKEQRSFSKPPVLGAGFMLGWKGLIAYAEGYGVEMTEDQAQKAINTFRGMYPEIVKFWDWIYKCVKYVTATGVSFSGYRMNVERDEHFLRIWLPSGRALSYYKPENRMMPAPWDPKKQIENFTYMGTNDKNQWVRISAHAGGITENIVQSIAGDILWNGLTNANAVGLKPILHVHDEIGCESDVQTAEKDLQSLIVCMTTQPDWCKDMWLGADGMITNRYTKD